MRYWFSSQFASSYTDRQLVALRLPLDNVRYLHDEIDSAFNISSSRDLYPADLVQLIQDVLV